MDAFGHTLQRQGGVLVCQVGPTPVSLELPLGTWGSPGRCFTFVSWGGRSVGRQQTLPRVIMAVRQAVIVIREAAGRVDRGTALGRGRCDRAAVCRAQGRGTPAPDGSAPWSTMTSGRSWASTARKNGAWARRQRVYACVAQV
jgi:hypothetical protein